jgi:transposase
MEQISMNKTKDILKQKFSRKMGYRKIAANLNLSIATVANYVARAKRAGITSWSVVENMSEQELHQKLFGKHTKKQCPTIDYDHVHKELKKKGVTLLLLWQEYKEANPNGIGYTQFCLHYRRYKKNLDPVMVQTHKAGEKCFVDYAGTTIVFYRLCHR